MTNPFALWVEQCAVIEPSMPKDQPGPKRKDDWQIISGILHVLRSAAVGRIRPPLTAHTRGSTTATTGDLSVESGSGCLPGSLLQVLSATN